MLLKKKLALLRYVKISVFTFSIFLANSLPFHAVNAQGTGGNAVLEQLLSGGVIPDAQDPMPDNSGLASPQTPVSQDEVLNGAPGGPTPALVSGQEPGGEELFFDSNALVPQSEQSQKGAPSRLDPKTSPASTFIIVRKNAAAGSAQANVVAAGRALKLGRYDAALELYDEIYEESKRDPNVLLGRAVTLQKLERFDEAISTYEELLDIAPDNVEAHLNMLGLVAQRYPSVAIQRLLELRKKNPNNAGISSQVAIAYAQLGRYDDAMKYLGIAAGMSPRNPSYLYNMAIIADRAGEKKQAVDLYEKALDLDSIHGGGRSIPRSEVYERLAELR